MGQAVPVEIVKTEEGWQLLRDGEPYFIRGAGGAHSLKALADAGGNSIRTWDATGHGGEDLGVFLDEAHSLGLTVSVGIWLGHERHGFDYSDPGQVQRQMMRALEIVERYKDHPAVLLWGIGNEMEGFEDGGNPAIWQAVNDIAEKVKEIDPNHPTMTTTAFAHGKRIEFVHDKSPGIDIHGINAYGGALAFPAYLDENGGSKPYVLTEFGPLGPWETAKTDWGAPIERTSTEKAAFYRRAYTEALESAPGKALGGYAFLWGKKMEATETWFGMFLHDGAATGAVDAMTMAWTGEAPKNLAPTVEPLQLEGDAKIEPGAQVKVSATVSDPEEVNLRTRWVLRPESGDYLTGGDYRPRLGEIDGAVIHGDAAKAEIAMPEAPGAYRLFFYAYDNAGKAATANLPLLVKGEPAPRMPYVVYDNTFDYMPWSPSGWMGNTEALSVDGQSAIKPHSGDACIRIRYDGVFGWAGVAWQHPENNWGDVDGGIDVSGADALEVWARGAYGGEKISVGVGLIAGGMPFPDSGIRKLEEIELTSEWTLYRVPLDGVDLSSIKTGFFVALTGRQKPVTIYLDDIRFIN